MRTWQSGTKRCELAVEVEASSWYHYIPPDGRLYLPFLYELGGWEPRAGRRKIQFEQTLSQTWTFSLGVITEF